MRFPISFHESFERDQPGASSERSLGLLFAAFFLVIALFPVFLAQGTVNHWSLVLAVAFALAALRAPRLLRPLNRAWMKLGLVLHAVASPLVMGLVFYLTGR